MAASPASETGREGDPVDLLVASLDPYDGPVSIVDTHISTIVLQDGWAYKVKRPVHFEFVDLSTVERRRQDCEQEVTQNRRFAPDVYDGVIEILDTDGHVVDHAVKMRRMPEDRRLSTLAGRPDPDGRTADAITAVARDLAVAHARAPRGPHISAVATPAAFEHLWLRSTTDMRTYVPEIFDAGELEEIEHRVQSYVAGRHALLDERIARGLVVDGHGDLLADDIFCLDDGPRILDCLEFDPALRYGDVLLDLAFLVMDLERLGAGQLANRLVVAYTEFSDEHHPPSLLDVCVAYRALVRAKIAAIRNDRAAARQLLELSLRHLRMAEPRLVIVGGLPASGKTTLAAALAAETGWTLLEADAVRKELTGVGAAAAPAAFEQGIYTPEATEHTYATLLERARVSLEHGTSVVLDASFVDGRRRDDAAGLAAAVHARFVALHCTAPAEVRLARLATRPHDPEHLSDADAAIAARMAARESPWSAAVEIETSGALGAALEVALAALGAA